MPCLLCGLGKDAFTTQMYLGMYSAQLLGKPTENFTHRVPVKSVHRSTLSRSGQTRWYRIDPVVYISESCLFSMSRLGAVSAVHRVRRQMCCTIRDFFDRHFTSPAKLLSLVAYRAQLDGVFESRSQPLFGSYYVSCRISIAVLFRLPHRANLSILAMLRIIYTESIYA